MTAEHVPTEPNPPAEPVVGGADAWPHLSAGAVVAGRWAVARTVADIDGVVVLDAVDRSLGDRPVVLVAVRELDPAEAIAIWRDASAVGASPALDVVAVRDGVIGVFFAGEQACRLTRADDLSRAQRAALWVDAWSVLEGLRSDGVSARIAHPCLLWTWGRRSDARSCVIAVPASSDAWADDVTALAGMLAASLWGTSDAAAAAEVLDTLPDDVATVLRPCFDPSPDPARTPSAAALAASLGAGDAAHRVPVPVARSPRRGPDATWATRRRRITRSAAKGLALAGGVIALLAVTFAALLHVESVEPPMPGATNTIPAAQPRPWVDTTVELPMPEIRTRPWQERLIDWGEPVFYNAWEHGPSFGGVGPAMLEPPDGNVGYVRAYLQGERVARVDRFAASGQLLGFELVTWDGDAPTVLWHSPAGRIERETAYLDGGLTLRERAAGGRTTEPGCHELRLTRDAEGRVASSRCVDRTGQVVPFPGGFDALEFRYGPGDVWPAEQYLVDSDGDLVEGADGWAVLSLTWDDHGRVTSRATFDSDGRLVPDPSTGAPVEVTTWHDEQGIVRRTLHGAGDVASRPFELPDVSDPSTRVVGANGWHHEEIVQPPGGDVIRRMTFDLDGRWVRDASIGAAMTEHLLDERGHIVETVWFDEDRMPTTLATGVLGPAPSNTRYVVDVHGLTSQECDFDASGEPIASARLGGRHCVVYWRDHVGRVTAVAWYGTDRRPATHAEIGAHRVEYELETHGSVEQGRVVAEARYDIDGEPLLFKGTATAVRTSYNAFGDISVRQYVDRDDVPAAMGEPDRYTWTWDPRGRWSSHCRFHSAPSDAARTRHAPCVVRIIQDDRVTRITYTDATGEVPMRSPMVDAEGLTPAHVDFVYDDAGGLMEQVLRNEYGERQQVDPLDCSRERTCVDVTGRGWWVP